MLTNEIHSTVLNSPNQDIKARVEIYKGSTLEKICNCGKELSEFTIERAGENKFFGYGICQKLKTVFFDEETGLSLTKDNSLEATFGVNGDYMYPFPNFYVEEVARDEETGDITVTAYDALYKAANHTVSELALTAPYTLSAFATACAAILGVPLNIDDSAAAAFETRYPAGANFDGTETLRSALDALAEATQTIYYINNDWALTFKRLDKSGDSVFTIDRSNYMELSSEGPRILSKVSHVTELGDNVEPTSDIEGVTQYIRNNPFWELRDDIGTLVDSAQALVGGISIEQCECLWFGNYLLEIGDKIDIIAKADKTMTTYLLEDSLTFDGAIEQITKWKYDENDAETAANPTSIGDRLNQTFARVDKVNQQIELVSSETSGNTSAIAALQINTNSISASVKEVEKNVEIVHDEVKTNYETLTKEVNTKVSAEDVQITISQELANGVDKVTTSTGFTFNNEGLTVSKSDSEMSTTITEDGMTIDQKGTDVLVANNQGVVANKLHATTYLWIGNNSRFEDQGERTACFWIED